MEERVGLCSLLLNAAPRFSSNDINAVIRGAAKTKNTQFLSFFLAALVSSSFPSDYAHSPASYDALLRPDTWAVPEAAAALQFLVLAPADEDAAAAAMRAGALVFLRSAASPDTAPALAPAVHAAISGALPLLRRLKHRQEDIHPRRRSESPRRDVEDVYALVAALVRHAPDTSLSFWDDRAFLDWAIAVRTPSMLQGLLEMLTSLASCAPDNAHRLLLASHGRASYTAFFASFHAVAQAPTAVPPDEWAILVPFCALVRTILSNSPPARALLYLDTSFRAVPTLVSLLALPIDIATKGAILKTLSSFAIASSEPHLPALDRRRDIWFHLEASAVVDTNPSPSAPPSGILAELKLIEEPAKQYPASTAFVELLAALAQPFSSSSSSAPSTLHSPLFPLNLGAPHRSPGLDPYVNFVIDQVFLPAPNRPYANAPEKWVVLDQALAFMQASLASLSFSSFLLPQQTSQAQSQSQPQANDIPTPADHVLAHPGFDIFLRILSASPLLDALCHIASSLLDDLENDTPNTPAFKSAVKHTLHIFTIVLDLHPVFAQLVQPLLLQTPNLPLSTPKLNMLRSADALDALLLSQPHVVVRIATLINCTADAYISLYSVKIISHLSQSPHWSSEWQFRDFYNTKMNRLVGVVDTSDETLRIVDGYSRLLEPRSSDYYSPLLDEDAENDDNNDSLLSHTSRHRTIDDEIKCAILDLLIQNTSSNAPAPNIAHLLLGYDLNHSSSRGQLELKSLASPGSGRAAIHVVLLLIDPQSHGHHFRNRHPDLAQKCYNLIQQLCHHAQTNASTSRYLRSQENYFYLQSLGLPFAIPSAHYGSRGIVRHTNGKQVHTSCAALTSTLHSEASLLESVALELNNLVMQNNRQHAKAITSAFLQNFSLHSNNSLDETASILPDFLNVSNLNHNNGNISSSPDQSECRILNTFYSLDFVWQDDISLHQLNSPILAGLPYNTTLRKDTNGCQIYDLKAILLLINTAQQDFQRKGLLTNTQEEQIKSESKVVLLWFASENNRLQVEHARVHMLKAWRMLLDICLVHEAAFEYAVVDPSNRRSLLLNLLYTVLLPLSAPDTTSAQAEILSGASLVIIARLRSESASTTTMGMGTSDAVDKLHNLLKLTLRSISQPGISPVVRGNLYSLLLNYFAFTNQLASSSTSNNNNSNGLNNNGLLRSGAGSVDDDILSLNGGSTAGFSYANRSIISKHHSHNTTSSLQDGISNTLNSYLERTLLTICSDAAGGPEVWQAVAFATLDVLSSLKDSSSSSSSSLAYSKSSSSLSAKIVSILAKHGELQNIVLSLKETESQLMDVLSPEPSSLNSLYTYEAKMSFLIQLSRNRQSALKLVDAKIIYVLAQCEYLNSPGSFDQYTMDQDTDFDTFLPSLIEIQHQLVIPALQLVVNLVAATATETPACISQAIQFISSKHTGMVECLRTTATTTAAPTISGIQESKLIVTLLRLVMSSPHLNNTSLHGSGDFLSPSSGGFGSLHAAIRLFLVDFFPYHHQSQRHQYEESASVLPTSSWLERINPSNEAEMNDAKTEIISPSLGLTTVFDEECSDLLDGLCSALLSYLVTATRRPSSSSSSSSKSFYPVFDPTFAQTAAPARGKTPTLFHLASFAENVATLLGIRMELLLEIIYRFENADDIAIAELDEYVLPDDIDKSESERRIAAKITLARILPLARNKAVLTLHLVEMSLLLFWRHLCHYLGTSDQNSGSSVTIADTSNLFGGGGSHHHHLGSESSKSHIRNNAKLYMDRISNLLSPSWMLNESFGLEVRSHQALIDSLRRNCNDIVNSNMNESV